LGLVFLGFGACATKEIAKFKWLARVDFFDLQNKVRSAFFFALVFWGVKSPKTS
jgi:hypothetical protein